MDPTPRKSSIRTPASRSERRNCHRVPCQFMIQYRGHQRASWDLSPLRELGSGGARQRLPQVFA